MSTWTAFYIKTSELQDVVEKLKSLTGIQDITVSAFPSDISDSYLMDEVFPNYLVIGEMQPGWITVIYNSFSKLQDWCSEISKHFDTIVILVSAQSVSDYYYFAFYDKGVKKRELEFCYSDDFNPTNFGDKFSFENEEPGERNEYEGEVSYHFTFSSIEEYCKHFGLTLQLDYDKGEWTILKGTKTGRTMDDWIKHSLKPWWKFW